MKEADTYWVSRAHRRHNCQSQYILVIKICKVYVMSAYKTYTSPSFCWALNIAYWIYIEFLNIWLLLLSCSFFNLPEQLWNRVFISRNFNRYISRKKENKNRNKKKILTEHMLNKVVLFDLVRKVLMKFPHPRI